MGWASASLEIQEVVYSVLISSIIIGVLKIMELEMVRQSTGAGNHVVIVIEVKGIDRWSLIYWADNEIS